MLFTGCSVLAGEGTLIIKASHKGKHHGCILIHGAVGSGRISNAECSQQDCCGECEAHSLLEDEQISGDSTCVFFMCIYVDFKTSRSWSCILFSSVLILSQMCPSSKLVVQACVLFSLPVLWIRVPGFCLVLVPVPLWRHLLVVNLPSLCGRIRVFLCQFVPAFSCLFWLLFVDFCTELDLPASSAFWVQPPPHYNFQEGARGWGKK